MASPTVLESDTLVSSKKSKDRHLRKRDYERDVESEEDYDVREPERSHEKKKSRSKVKDKSERDKGRDGEGERGKSRGKDRDREKGRDRDNDKVKESRHRDKEKHKEDRAREKEKLREEREREKERLREEKERQRAEKERLREEKEHREREKEKARLKEEKEHREREKEKARLKEEKDHREREKEKARLKEKEQREREKERVREEKEQREREKERLREEKEQREREKRLREEKEQREKERLREEKEREKERLREEKELRERLRLEKEQKEREKERLRAEKEQQERERGQKEWELREEEQREKEREKLRVEQELKEDKEKKDKEKLKEQREREKLKQDREKEKKEEKEKLKEDRAKEKLREGRDREKEIDADVAIALKDKDRVPRDREKDRDRHRDDKDRPKDREKDKHVDREKEKGKDKEKKRRDRDKDKERDKEKLREREKERDEDEDRDRERKRRKKEDDVDLKEKDKDKQKDRDKADDEGGDRDRKRKRREEETDKVEGKVKKEAEEEDPDEEQRKLDEEMEKRRRRVQEWQELRRRKEEEERKKRGEAEDVVELEGKKTWTLEGEESDDEDLPKVDEPSATDGDSTAGVLPEENEDLVTTQVSAVEIVSEVVDETMAGIEAEGALPPNPLFEVQPDSDQTSPPAVKPVEEDDVDPLDAFMNTMIIPEVEKLNSMDPSPAEIGKSEVRLKDRGGMDNGKHYRRSSRNATGRIIPGEDSPSEDEREEGEGAAGDEEDDDFLKRVKKTKADKLAPVDHSKIQYPSFRKNFYIEVKEIVRMHADEVSTYRKELELKIRGKDVPRPVKTWNQTGLSSKALDVIKKSGFDKPMPIQAQALPIIMSGRDCIGIAKTGSGKTLAFVLPMLRHIMDQPPLSQGDGPIGLVMAPTRELVQQIYNDIKRFTKVLGLSCVPVYGGSGVAQQISDLKRGTEIVVCTPGRMIDILCTSAGKITNLRRVTYFVMDEADRMFDMGFEPQITRIVQNTRPDRQTVLFSATFPRQVEVLARKVLTKPIEIQVGGRSVVNRDITQTVEVRPDNERFLRLLELLGEWYEKGKILIFVHSQEKCDSLFRDLLKAGYPCLSLHGAKEQTDRESTIADFKRNVCNLMIATSVAARGLDVKELELVVNYDVPNHYEDYVHRVGRTGRAGRKGVAVTFISIEEDRYAPDLVKALELSEQPVPDDLKKLADDFMTKVSQGTEQAHGSGYGGSGFKFNEEEDEARKAAKKAQAKEYGFEEDEDKSDSDSDDGTIRKQGGDLSEAAAQAAQAAALAAATKAAQPSTNPQFQAALLAAQAAASRSLQSSALTGGLGMMPGLTGLTGVQMMGGFVGMAGIPGMSAIGSMANLGITGFPALGLAAAGTPAASAMSAAMGDGAARAAAYAAALNLQHNLAKIQADAIPEHYEAELEINDFPQHARWKVTHKDALGQISEWTGAAITTRGQYFPAGKNPSPGERKLFLFIEGPTEASVKKAKAEIKRILEESTSAAISLPGSTQPGKYSVL